MLILDFLLSEHNFNLNYAVFDVSEYPSCLLPSHLNLVYTRLIYLFSKKSYIPEQIKWSFLKES